MVPLTLKEVENVLKQKSIKYYSNDAAEQTFILKASFKILCEEYKVLGNSKILHGLLER